TARRALTLALREENRSGILIAFEEFADRHIPGLCEFGERSYRDTIAFSILDSIPQLNPASSLTCCRVIFLVSLDPPG
ncbi:MAG: hypothetical protein DMG06_30100, partial [Acidobacteria bacterium]